MKRTVVGALFLLAALGVAMVQAQGVATQAAPAPASTAGGVRLPLSQTMQPSFSPLAPTFSAKRFTFNLIGFGRVGYYVDSSEDSASGADTAGKGRPLLLLTSVNAAASAYEMRPLFEAYRGNGRCPYWNGRGSAPAIGPTFGTRRSS